MLMVSLTVGVWFVGLMMAVILCALMVLIQEARLSNRMVDVQLKGLGETYLAGYEALTLSLNRLEARVKVLED